MYGRINGHYRLSRTARPWTIQHITPMEC